MDNTMEQCKRCLKYLGEQTILCQECQDKVNGYDICKRERDFLLSAVQKASEELSELNLRDSADTGLKTGRANGHLLVALGFCKDEDNA